MPTQSHPAPADYFGWHAPGGLFPFEYLKPFTDRYAVISKDMRNRGPQGWGSYFVDFSRLGEYRALPQGCLSRRRASPYAVNVFNEDGTHRTPAMIHEQITGNIHRP